MVLFFGTQRDDSTGPVLLFSISFGMQALLARKVPTNTIILKSNPSKSEPIIKEPIQESRIEPLKNLSPNSAEVSNIPVKPVSAFMIFANEWRKRLTVEHPNETNKQISLRLGNMWKSLSDETKDTFYEAASRQYDKMKSQSDSRWKT
ncbi:hypothetical protein HHI36_011147 [Cryptolaemus montrouzieri]|uniref:Sex-determining region Y protein n=1 Tax=Cryptolaemus montrouzieri TaxID=559131 RepID=A0ABD2MKZ3_9CUCU